MWILISEMFSSDFMVFWTMGRKQHKEEKRGMYSFIIIDKQRKLEWHKRFVINGTMWGKRKLFGHNDCFCFGATNLNMYIMSDMKSIITAW